MTGTDANGSIMARLDNVEEFQAIAQMLLVNGDTGLLVVDREGCLLAHWGGLAEHAVGPCAVGDVMPLLVGYETVLDELLCGQRRSFHIPYVTLHHSSAPDPLFLSMHLYTDPEKEVVAVLLQDMTKMVELEQQVQQQYNELILTRRDLEQAKEAAEAASRAKTAFLSNVNHELRVPLNVIIGNAELLRDPGTLSLDEEGYQVLAEDVRHAGMFLLDLVNDMLDLARVEAGADELAEEIVDLKTILQDAVDMVKTLPMARGVDFDFRYAVDARQVYVDPRRLKQMVINLLTNAVKFTPQGGQVTVTAGTFSERGCLAIDIADTGAGIAPEDLPRLMEPFQQGAAAPRGADFEGAGLGLPLVKSLAELHGGSLELSSMVNKGTTARICLPEDRIVERSGV